MVIVAHRPDALSVIDHVLARGAAHFYPRDMEAQFCLDIHKQDFGLACNLRELPKVHKVRCCPIVRHQPAGVNAAFDEMPAVSRF
ncbi:hypothetical protein [Agrobacterium radiobacter]|uniref:hypothetical protein n=1 Tax=Agrobacterium radiobacter TaxID=362 RepID=UPI003CE53899